MFELRRELLDRFMLSTQVSVTQSGELLKILSDNRRQPVERRLANMAVGCGQGVSRRVEAMYRTATWKPYEQGSAEQKQQESVHGLCPQPMGRRYPFLSGFGIVLRIDPDTMWNSYNRHSNGPLKRGMRFDGARPMSFGIRKSPVKI